MVISVVSLAVSRLLIDSTKLSILVSSIAINASMAFIRLVIFRLTYFPGSLLNREGIVLVSLLPHVTFICFFLLLDLLVLTRPSWMALRRLDSCASTWQGGGTREHFLRWFSKFQASSRFIAKLLFTVRLFSVVVDCAPLGSGPRHSFFGTLQLAGRLWAFFGSVKQSASK